MSDADETAEALWEEIGGDTDNLLVNGSDADPNVAYVTREAFEGLVERQNHLEDTVKRLTRLVNNLQSDGLDGLSTLEKYTRMVENGELGPLSASDVRAVSIHRNWASLASRLASGQLGVNTRKKSGKKHGPSQLKSDLQHILDEELENIQIYRAMKRTAELSGGSAEPDEYGRMHIVGGIYEYHERTTPDNTDHTSYKVLIEA